MQRSNSSALHTFRRNLAVGLVLFAAPATCLAQGTGYWHTSGNQILDSNGKQVRIAGINWYGFETTRAVAGGLTSQDYKTILSTIKTQGYNTVRLPFSNQMVESPSVPSSISYSNGSGAINSDLSGLNSLQIMDKIVSYAGTLGLKVILDNHRSEAGDSAESNGLWYTSSYPESAWINDWKTLASRYLNNTTVIGFDLRNEPHNATSGGACWDCGGATDWHLAAERAGNAVLTVNPKLLIFVEGTDAYNNDYYWWGGNLEGVKTSPVTLSVANQLVYSAHDYGPTEYGQSWFSGSTTAASLDTIWTNHWGYVAKNGIAPVWLGEFGTTNDAASVQSSTAGSEGQWFQSLVAYLKADSTLNWTYWALNGEDRYGLLDSNYDATPASAAKESTLKTIQSPFSPSIAPAAAPAAPSGLTATAASANSVNLSWKASSTSGVTYTVYFGTTSGSTATVVASNVSGTAYTATNLNPSTTYYFTVKAVSSAGISAASNQASAATPAAAAPGAPSGLTATASSSSQVNLSWKASATSGVKYNVYYGTSTGSQAQLASNLAVTSYAASGLTAATTYYFTVKAVSSAGGVSAASNQASAKTQAASASGSCHVTYSGQSDWGSGFTGSVSFTNTGSASLTSWTLSWTFSGNQQLTQSWSGNYVQSGKSVTITNASYNGSVAAGATVSGIGFNASYSGTNAVPTAFSVNGVLCK